MTATQRTIGWARRRLLWHTTLHLLGWGLLVAAALAGVAVVAMQGFGAATPWWLYAALAGAAAAVALVMGFTRRPTADATAVMVDDRLGLKDSLGTSLYAAKLQDSEMTRRVMDDAERVAASAKVGEAFPVRPTRVWGWALGSAAVVALLTLDPFGLHESALQRAAAAQAATQEAKQIEEALAQAAEAAEALAEEKKPGGEDAAAMDPADLDEQLEAMLSQRDLTNPEDRQDTAAEVSDLQERFEQAIEQKQAQVDALQNAMSALDPGERGPADKFADALRRGDFSAAQQELAALADEMESGDLSEQQKQQAAQQMQALADQLDEMAEQQERLAEQAEQAAQQAMDNAGLSQEQKDQLAEGGYDPEAVKQAMQQALEQMQGMSKEDAQQLAQQMQQAMQNAQQQAQNSQNAGDAAEQLAQQMSQMSKAMQEQTLQNSQLAEAMQQMQQQLGECAGDQQQLDGMKSASQKMQEAMQRLAGSPGSPPGSQGGPSGGGVGPGEGDGSGGNPIGEERAALGTASHASSDMQEGQGGRVLTSWTRDGQMSKGETKLSFNRAVTDAKADAERAVTEDRTPKRYHKAIKDYFNNLPDAPPEE